MNLLQRLGTATRTNWQSKSERSQYHVFPSEKSNRALFRRSWVEVGWLPFRKRGCWHKCQTTCALFLQYYELYDVIWACDIFPSHCIQSYLTFSDWRIWTDITNRDIWLWLMHISGWNRYIEALLDGLKFAWQRIVVRNSSCWFLWLRISHTVS